MSYSLPISIKGVVVDRGRVCLLRNERDEWELPGGKLDPGETPEQCLAREVTEELGIGVQVTNLLDAWVYSIRPGVEVFIVTYRCCREGDDAVRRSDEHSDVGWFTFDQIKDLNIPSGYLRAVTRAVPEGESKVPV